MSSLGIHGLGAQGLGRRVWGSRVSGLPRPLFNNPPFNRDYNRDPNTEALKKKGGLLIMDPQTPNSRFHVFSINPI